MTPRLSGHFSIFGLVFFVLNFLLGIARQLSREQFAILTLKPRIHVRILMYIERGLLWPALEGKVGVSSINQISWSQSYGLNWENNKLKMSMLEAMIKRASPRPPPAGNTIYSLSFLFPFLPPIHNVLGAALSRASQDSVIYVFVVYGLRSRAR